MKIAVLGSGNGGIAVAADWALHGHNVYLYDFEAFDTNIPAIQAQGGIHCSGDLNGFAKIAYAGHALDQVLCDAELIFVVGPAYSTKPFAQAVLPYLKAGQRFIICPASACGAIVFKQALGIALENDTVIVADTSTLPYACRVLKPGNIHVYLKLKGGLFIAALPGRCTPEIHQLFSTVYACSSAKNVWQTTLQNGNPVIHPIVTLLNAGRIESTNGNFYFYEDGVTPGVGTVMSAIDHERVAVAEQLGVSILLDADLGILQGYMQTNDYETGYRNAQGFKGIKAQSALDHRYLHEDVGYGLVLISELGRLTRVPTPAIDAVILLASIMMKKSYGDQQNSMLAALGFKGFTAKELVQAVES